MRLGNYFIFRSPCTQCTEGYVAMHGIQRLIGIFELNCLPSATCTMHHATHTCTHSQIQHNPTQTHNTTHNTITSSTSPTTTKHRSENDTFLIDCQAKVVSTAPIYMGSTFRLHFVDIESPSCLGLQLSLVIK